AASLLVLISVVASNRARQIHEATVLYTLGARFSAIRSALWLEQILIMILTSLFALGLGGLIAHGLLEWRLDLQSDGIWWTAVILAPLVSGLSLGLGARYLLRQFRLAPATLLRSSG
ncbi:MAG: ABC transporter permease, partial [Candidatus Competibacteraceae bacterium]|nr:ABC transporter permease [Candidatus Competibacteraceae bacterium]MCB1812052.1 ABC transporter permease [Candidatus Competibacteraceae bacterium]